MITRSLEAGDGPENIRDRWSAKFDKYVVAIGHIDAHLGTWSELAWHNGSQIAIWTLTALPTR